MERSCAKCEFMDMAVNEMGEPYMECHRYPPTVVWGDDEDDLDTAIGHVFPGVIESTWCGEFKSRSE